MLGICNGSEFVELLDPDLDPQEMQTDLQPCSLDNVQLFSTENKLQMANLSETGANSFESLQELSGILKYSK